MAWKFPSIRKRSLTRKNTVFRHFNAGQIMENGKTTEKYKYILVDNVRYKTMLTKKFVDRKVYEEEDPRKIKAFIPGTIRKVFVKEGQKIREGTRLLTLEAMKMNNLLTSPVSGTIKHLNAKPGQTVAKDELLLELE
jgi:pyruvate carboxylase